MPEINGSKHTSEPLTIKELVGTRLLRFSWVLVCFRTVNVKKSTNVTMADYHMYIVVYLTSNRRSNEMQWINNISATKTEQPVEQFHWSIKSHGRDTRRPTATCSLFFINTNALVIRVVTVEKLLSLQKKLISQRGQYSVVSSLCQTGMKLFNYGSEIIVSSHNCRSDGQRSLVSSGMLTF